MRALFIGLAALAAALAIAAPGLSRSTGPATIQINVTETNHGCRLALLSVSAKHRLVLFHMINDGTVPHGIIVLKARSTMVLPKQSGNLYYRFSGPGRYSWGCTAGTYAHPIIITRGIFTIRKT